MSKISINAVYGSAARPSLVSGSKEISLKPSYLQKPFIESYLSLGESHKDDDVKAEGEKYKHYMHLMTLSYDYMMPFAFEGRLAGFIGPTMGL